MKKFLLIGSVIAILSLLTVFWAVPALAQGTENEELTPADPRTWESMHEACEEGDWEAMAEAAEEVHKDLGYLPCHSDDYPATEDGSQVLPNRWGGMGGHMGGGMMGGGWGGMM